jgi:hypothetical protein
MNEAVSGKKVVILSLLGFFIFSVLMGYGTYAFAQWLTPILQRKDNGAPAVSPAQAKSVAAPSK